MVGGHGRECGGGVGRQARVGLLVGGVASPGVGVVARVQGHRGENRA